MHLLSFLLFTLTAAASVANGYLIDPDLEDGAYYIPLLPNSTHAVATYGEPIHLGDAEFSGNMSAQHVVGVVPVPADSGVCFNAIEHKDDLEGAKKILSDLCDSGKKIPAHGRRQAGIILGRYGSSVAWACSARFSQGCAPNEIDDAWGQISKNCKGDTYSGEICISRWSKCYGHCASKGVICGNMT
ncbi:hypothetical protein F5Y08DRAFT_354709 [Xylaria arbuscula]|nr:hypothetical protein F5Y08DRAFT_354709 [Xylaria arbuscula]